MFKFGRLLPLGFLLLSPGFARQDFTVCGTTRDRAKEELFLHQQSVARRARLGKTRQAAAAAGRDVGNIFVLEATDDILSHRNDFDLDRKTVTFTPSTVSGSRYRFASDGPSLYDELAATTGTRIDRLGDDDFRLTPLPFPFPFFGETYRQVYINSDGNLTFGEGDNSSSARSLGRAAGGPPRIAGLFRDLDPGMSASGVRVTSAADRFVVTWLAVPEFANAGTGPIQTFQIRLSPDGRIDFSYSGITTSSALVGIAPGRMQGTSTVLDLSVPNSQEFSSTVVERFASTNEIDTVTASVRFFETHEDAYDYVVIFNRLDLWPMPGAIAATDPVRQRFKGVGDGPVDVGTYWGSRSRLQAVINMGPLSQYPDDLNNGLVPGRVDARDTPVTILAHESGHLFLAYASIKDAAGARPMVGFQSAHWSFVFNSEASLLEGNRLQDDPGGSPRFRTVAVTEHYSPLDQYLMGLRAPEEVPPTFVALNASINPNRHPMLGVAFDGIRQDVRVEDVIAAEGRRIPDHTVAQRRFRWAFIYVVPQGTAAPQADIDKLNAYRTAFEAYFSKATDDRAIADTSLRRALQVSTYPAAGLVQGAAISASVTVAQPVAADLAVSLSAPQGFVSVPSQVVIPAGARSVKFQITGVRTGVEELVAQTADTQYETSYSRLQVSPSLAAVKLITVSGDRQVITAGTTLEPVVIKAVDANELPYAGVNVLAAVSTGGSVTPQAGITGEDGTVSFLWTPSAEPANELKASLGCACAPASGVRVVALGRPAVSTEGVVNAASYRAGITPGGLATIFGSNLSALAPAIAPSANWPLILGDVRVSVSGRPARLTYTSDSQINFLVPSDVPAGAAQITVTNSLGTSGAIPVQLQATAPAIFFDAATGTGAVLLAGTGLLTTEKPAGAGDYLEVYTTGLGPVHTGALGLQETDATVQATIGSLPATVVFSGLTAAYPGLYQVNVLVPNGVPPGLQTLSITAGQQASNEVKVRVR